MREKRNKKHYKIIAFFMACVCVLSVAGCHVNKKIDCVALRSVNLMEGYTKQAVSSEDNELTEFNHEKTMDFAVRILQNGMKKEKNSLLSPISILAALSMTANGAKGETLEQMEEMFGLSVDSLNKELSAYMEICDRSDDYKVDIANAIWFTEAEHFTVNPAFLQTNANYYNADIYAAPFDDSTVADINRWVNWKTDGMIPEAINSIDPSIVMYLINAVCFDAQWKEKYTKSAIREGVFTKEDGTTQQVEFMYSEEYVYLEDENATGFMKYYKGGDYAFVAMLPREGMALEEYIASLSGENLLAYVTDISYDTVNVSIPKFEYEYQVDLTGILSEMGMTDAFDADKADFTGLGTSTIGNIFINSVMHKTFISVDENGTKAAAVTTVAPGCESEPAEPKVVHLDRPFVYMIYETSTCKPLFIGTVVDLEVE